MFQAKNLIAENLASGNINSSQTTLPLATGKGASFPSTANGYYELVIWKRTYESPLAAYRDSKAEIVLVTSHDGSSDTISTIVRAQGGTSAVDFSSDGTCEAVLDFTKTLFDHLNDRVEIIAPVSVTTKNDPFNSTNAPSHVCNPIGGFTQGGALAYAKDILMATPDFEVAGSVLRGIKLRKNTASNKLVASIGIYSNTTLNGNRYPGTKLAEIVFTNTTDASPIITDSSVGATTIVSSDLPYTYPSSGIYWYAFILSDSSSGIAPISLLTLSATGGGRAYLGWVHSSSTILGAIMGVEDAFSYAALPSTFPSSAPDLICSGRTRTTFPWMTKITQALA